MIVVTFPDKGLLGFLQSCRAAGLAKERVDDGAVDERHASGRTEIASGGGEITLSCDGGS